MRTKRNKILVLLVLLTIGVMYVEYASIQSKLSSLDFQLHHLELEARSKPVSEHSSKATARTFLVQANGFYVLPDVEANEAELAFKSETNIFFVVSTVFKAGLARLNPRQACAIESAARANPGWKVFVLFVSASGFNFLDNVNIKPLIPMPNVHLRSVNMETYGLGTPLAQLLADGRVKSSCCLVEHTSDLVRVLTVYKYGGTYLDTDVVVMRPFDELPLNYLVSEGDGFVAAGFISLAATGVGHTVAELFLRELAANFNGKVWAMNGPFLVTRILQKFCNVTQPRFMTRKQCGGEFEVLPPNNFFQVFYPQQVWFFQANMTEEVLKRVKGRVLTHVWNGMTRGIKLKKDSRAAYIELAKRFCPAVLENCDDEF